MLDQQIPRDTTGESEESKDEGQEPQSFQENEGTKGAQRCHDEPTLKQRLRIAQVSLVLPVYVQL